MENELDYVGVSFESPESSNIAGARYDMSTHTLTVTFKRGDERPEYEYHKFPPEAWQEFAQATSKGRHFSGFIRPIYNGVPVTFKKAALGVLLAFLLSVPAHAAPITYAYTGTLAHTCGGHTDLSCSDLWGGLTITGAFTLNDGAVEMFRCDFSGQGWEFTSPVLPDERAPAFNISTTSIATPQKVAVTRTIPDPTDHGAYEKFTIALEFAWLLEDGQTSVTGGLLERVFYGPALRYPMTGGSITPMHQSAPSLSAYNTPTPTPVPEPLSLLLVGGGLVPLIRKRLL